MLHKLKKVSLPITLVLILIFCYSCNKKVSPKQEEEAKPVFFYTEQATDTLMKSVLLDETYIEFNNQFFLLKTKSDKEDLNFRFNLKTPRLFKFYSFNKPSSVPLTIYVTPGDSLSYKLENNIITFKGGNEAHYNFFKALYALKLDYPRYNEELGIFDYREKIKTDYQVKLEFLEGYVKHKDVSDSFYRKVKDFFKFQSLNRLLNRNMFPNATITNYSEHLKGVTIDMFNSNDQDDNVYFYLALTNYIFIVTEEKFKDNVYSKQALEYQLDLINKNLEGNIKEFAIAKMLSEFDKHLKTELLDFLQDKIDMYLPSMQIEKYKIVLQQMNRRLNTINNQLDDEVYESTLLNLSGDSITLKEVFRKQGDKIKVIDFWASWCAPCIKEIKKGNQYRKKLIQDKKIVFLYLSIDKNQGHWRNKVAELKEFGMDKNQYLIPESGSSVLRTFFNISSIPHYAILDSNNDVFLVNAPSPGDTLQFNDIIKRIEKLELK